MPDSDCLFCKIVAGELPSTKVAEDERTLAFMDINPATRGHALVIPRRHSRNLLEIPAEDLSATALGAQQIAQRLSDRLGADGVNLINSCGSVGIVCSNASASIICTARSMSAGSNGASRPWRTNCDIPMFATRKAEGAASRATA